MTSNVHQMARHDVFLCVCRAERLPTCSEGFLRHQGTGFSGCYSWHAGTFNRVSLCWVVRVQRWPYLVSWLVVFNMKRGFHRAGFATLSRRVRARTHMFACIIRKITDCSFYPIKHSVQQCCLKCLKLPPGSMESCFHRLGCRTHRSSSRRTLWTT